MAICLVVVMSNLKTDVFGNRRRRRRNISPRAGSSVIFWCPFTGASFRWAWASCRFSRFPVTRTRPYPCERIEERAYDDVSPGEHHGLIITGKVNWPLAIAMCIGAWAGGYIGSKLQQKRGNKFIRRCISVASIVMAAALLWDLVK